MQLHPRFQGVHVAQNYGAETCKFETCTVIFQYNCFALMTNTAHRNFLVSSTQCSALKNASIKFHEVPLPAQTRCVTESQADTIHCDSLITSRCGLFLSYVLPRPTILTVFA